MAIELIDGVDFGDPPKRGRPTNPIIDELAREVIAGNYATDWEAAAKNLHRIVKRPYGEDEFEEKHDKTNKFARRIKRRRSELLA